MFRRWLLGPVLSSLHHFCTRYTMDQQQLQEALSGIATGLTDASDQLSKGLDEVTNEIQSLKVKLDQAGATSPAVDSLVDSLQQRVAALKAVTQTLDDLNPDQPNSDTPEQPVEPGAPADPAPGEQPT